MSTSDAPKSAVDASDGFPRKLTPEAERALAEASERRRRAELERRETAPEIGGQSGPDPIRYGDWEKGGIISDF